MAITHIASTAAGGTANIVTTSAIDTTGANLIVIATAKFNSNAITVSDSKGNTWTPLTARTGGAVHSRIYYCFNPTVGSGHTFSISGTNVFPSIGVGAFGGVDAYEAESGSSSTTGTSRQPGALVPSVDGCLVISGCATGAGTPAIDSGFSENTVSFASGQHASVGIGRLIQATAASVNPTWSWTGSANNAVTLAVFTPTADPPPSSGAFPQVIIA
jgi:hypothetical protein